MSPRVFCTSCGASNPEDARFCNQCGVALVAEGDGKPPTMSGVGGAPRAQQVVHVLLDQRRRVVRQHLRFQRELEGERGSDAEACEGS